MTATSDLPVVDGIPVDPWGSFPHGTVYSVGPLQTGIYRFCARCGSLTTARARTTGSFDPFYGVPTVEVRVLCPNRRGPISLHVDSGWVPTYYLPERPAPSVYT